MQKSPSPKDTENLRNAIRNAETLEDWKKADRLYGELADVQERDASTIARHALAVRNCGDFPRATTMTRKACRMEPENIEHHIQLGKLYLEMHRYPEAERYLRLAHAMDPDDFEALRRLAQALQHEPDSRDEAEELLRHALDVHGDHVAIWQQLGAIIGNEPKRHAEAEHAFRKSLELVPGIPTTLHNLGLLCRLQGRLDEAEDYLLQAVEGAPENSGFAFSMGLCYYNMERMEKALEWCRKSAELDSKNVAARVYVAFCLFMLGRMHEGWEAYEKRLDLTEFKGLNYKRPRWDGSPLDGQTILLLSEQGFGDNLQFVRYAELVAERGGNVILVAMDAQERLFDSVSGVSMVLPGLTAPKHFHRYSSLMSLPYIFGTTEETIPANVPYLHARPEDVEKWRPRISSRPGLRVGIAWRGNPQHVNDRFRSTSLEEMSRLFDVEGVSFFSLMAERWGEEQELPDCLEDIGADFTDFADGAAAYELLDLVITIDSAPCHLAGGLGRPVWTMLPRGPDFRWGLEGESSPWYPTMKLYRQTSLGVWDDVYDRIERDLKAAAERKRSEG